MIHPHTRAIRFWISWRLLLLGVALGSLVGGVRAQVPPLINYQGSLVEGEFPVNDTLDMTFGLYDQETGGERLWMENRADVTVEGGRFSVLLGAEQPFPVGLFEQQDNLYLQVEVGGEALPRMQLVSTPFALRAGVAERVPDGAVDAAALADDAVTSAKVADNTLATADLADGAVDTGELVDGAVTNEKIAGEAVTNEKIADGAISSNKLRVGSVGPEQLANGAVIGSKIANNTIAGVDISNNTVVRSISGPGDNGGTVTLRDDVALEEGNNIDIQTRDDGTITISAGGVFGSGQPSSRRWKTDVRTIEDALSLVQRLRGVRFTWEENGQADVGLIAEEVGTVIPEIVTYEENGVDARTVKYNRLVAVLIEAIKQQQRQLDASQRKVEGLSERVTRLEQIVQHRTGEERPGKGSTSEK